MAEVRKKVVDDKYGTSDIKVKVDKTKKNNIKNDAKKVDKKEMVSSSGNIFEKFKK